MSEPTNSTNGSKPVEHGVIEPIDYFAPKPRPYMPAVLRGVGVFEFGISREEASRKYGNWTLEFLEDTMVYGTNVQKGSTAILPGNSAWSCVQTRNADFVRDDRAKAEEQLFADAAKLNLPQDVRRLAAFSEPKRKW
jgi:hypothetical protein